MNEVKTGGYVMGSGVVVAFLWNGFLVPMGAPEMDAEVAPAMGAVVWSTLRFIGGLFSYFTGIEKA